ncbi:Spi family protease inhibitor [Prevotella corporis]|uniref:Spi family protease inhibitor n=1 Tax=Prevotella corporis TaxID=28128 RepID=UPI0006842062|nr:Spi family protease inhibitor [Prevotella corporis]
MKASSSQRKAPSFSSNKLEILKENEAFTVVGAPTGGYVIISNDDLAPEVIGYSESAFNDENTNDNFKWYLQAVEKAVKNIVAKGKVLKVIKPNPAKYPQKIESFVNVKWGQQDPYNRLCPTAAKSNSTPGQNYHAEQQPLRVVWPLPWHKFCATTNILTQEQVPKL